MVEIGGSDDVSKGDRVADQECAAGQVLLQSSQSLLHRRNRCLFFLSHPSKHVSVL